MIITIITKEQQDDEDQLNYCFRNSRRNHHHSATIDSSSSSCSTTTADDHDRDHCDQIIRTYSVLKQKKYYVKKKKNTSMMIMIMTIMMTTILYPSLLLNYTSSSSSMISSFFSLPSQQPLIPIMMVRAALSSSSSLSSRRRKVQDEEDIMNFADPTEKDQKKSDKKSSDSDSDNNDSSTASPSSTPSNSDTNSNNSTTTTKQPVYEVCGFKSNTRFETWFGSLYTDSPVIFPINDTQLIEIVTTASSMDCKVRVVGTGHSEDGLVMSKTDHNVIIISLRYYVPDDKKWHENLDTKKPSIRMSAGSTQVDMLAYVRPKGYLGDTGTIGRIFTLGGVYLNPSTFGGWFNKTRLAPTVLAVRVLHADGTIAIYDEKNDSVRPFQGSMGLLGIVTALEIQLRVDTGLLMTLEKLDMNDRNYSINSTKTFLSNIILNNDGANFFYYGRIDTILVHVMNNYGNPDYNATKTIDWYNYAKKEGQFLKPTFTPEYITGLGTYITGMVPMMGQIIQDQSVKRLSNVNREQSIIPNDGYSHMFSVPNYEQISYFINCQTLYCIDEAPKLIDVTRTFMKDNVYNNNDSRFVDIFLFYRIFTVNTTTDLLFDHFKQSGYYIGVEIETIKTKTNRIKYSYTFKQIEDLWHNTFPNGTIHHGKAYGYGPITTTSNDNDEDISSSTTTNMENTEWVPFKNETIISSVYTKETKELFIQYMNMYDPKGTFRAGSVLHLLGLT